MKKTWICIIAAFVCFSACGKTVQMESNASDRKVTQAETTMSSETSTTETTETTVETKTVEQQKLPEFTYVGMDFASRICTEESRILNQKMFEAQDVMVPAFVIADFDESNDQDIRIWANLWIFNYKLNGDNLECINGGANPCLLHVKRSSESPKGYEIFSVDEVTDGAGYQEDIRRICENDEERMNILNSHEQMEEQRKQLLEMYVTNYGLPIKSYQDYGWDKVVLDV